MAVRKKKKPQAMGQIVAGSFRGTTETGRPVSFNAAQDQAQAVENDTAAQAAYEAQPPPVTYQPPFDLEAEKAKIGARYDEQSKLLEGNRTRLLLDYGYKDADGNPATADFVVDPNNPLSKAAMLKKSYEHARAHDQTSYASAGQSRSGAYVRQQNFRDTSEQQDSGRLLQALLGANAGIDMQQATLRGWRDDATTNLLTQYAQGSKPVIGELPPWEQVAPASVQATGAKVSPLGLPNAPAWLDSPAVQTALKRRRRR